MVHYYLSDKFKTIVTFAGASVLSFVEPVLPYGVICTAMVMADLISARMLARRARRRSGRECVGNRSKLSSRRIGAMITSLVKIYALLLLAHGVDCVIVCDFASFCLMRFSAALICFWQLWSILENEASSNDAPWARIAQRILIDKTERHLGVDLSDIGSKHSTTEKSE